MSRDPDPFVEAETSAGLDISLLEWMVRMARLAWRRKLLILLGVVVCMGLGVLYCLFVSPSYKSESQMLVQLKRPRSLPIPGVDPRLAVFQDPLTVHQNLLTSRLIAERAIARGNLTALDTLTEKKEEPSGDSFFSLGEAMDYFRSWFPAYRNSTEARTFDPAQVLIRGLDVTREAKDAILEDRSAAIFNLSFTCKSQEDCTKILKAVIDSYSSYLDETHRSDSDEVRELFIHWKDDLQKQLAEKEAEYREVLNGIEPLQWQSEGGINLSEQRVADIAQQRLSLLVQLSEDTERLSALRKARDEGVSNEVLFDLVTRWTRGTEGEVNERQQLFELMLKEKALVKTYGPMHREVEAVRDQIEAAARQVLGPSVDVDHLELMDPVEVYVKSLEQNSEVTRRQIDSLETLIEEEHVKAKKAHLLNEKLAQHQADVEVVRSLQKEVVNQLQEVDIVKNSEVVEAHLLLPPSPGRLSLLSSPIIVLIATGIVGLAFGGGLALLAETLNRGFRSPDEFRRRLQLPVMGHIPYRRLTRAAKRKARANDASLDPILITYHDRGSADAEAYRGVRAALYYRADTDGAKVIQVTSPVVGEGKSAVAANLAISIAQSGQRVLLVEADLRRASFPDLFGLSGDQGLASVLAGELQIKDAIQQTHVAGLDLLPAGPPRPGPGEQLTSPRFRQLLEDEAGKYDYVLVDTPPLLAVADPSAVAAQVDGVLLVLRNSRKARLIAERAVEQLAGVKARVLGVVVKGARLGRGRGGFGYADSEDWLRYSSKYKGRNRTGAAGEVDGGGKVS